MAWNPTHPATNAPVVSAALRGNFAALDTQVIAPLVALAPNQVLMVGAADQLAGVAAGTNGWVLTLVGGVPTWVALPIDPGFANPMTTLGDVIRAAASGVPQRLAIGTTGHVLTVVGGVPAWAAVPGFANPMTGVGDLIRGDTAGAPTRLAAGTNGHILTLTAGVPGWAAAPTSGFTNPMTTVGDVITGGASGVAGRLGIGTTGQVLTVVGGIPAWAGGSTRYVQLAIEGATLPDASGTGNNPPELVREVSAAATPTTNTPKVTRTYAKFDASTDEHLMWAFMLPSNYASGGTIRLKWKSTTTTTGVCVWKAGISVTIDGVSGDSEQVFNAANTVSSTVPGGAATTKEATITLTMTNAAANRWVTIFVGRDGDAGADTMAGDAWLIGVTFEYTA